MARLLVHILLVLTLALPRVAFSTPSPCQTIEHSCGCCSTDQGCMCCSEPTPEPEPARVDPPRPLEAVLPAFIAVTLPHADWRPSIIGHPAEREPSRVRPQAVLCRWLT